MVPYIPIKLLHSFEDGEPLDFIYGCLMFKPVADTSNTILVLHGTNKKSQDYVYGKSEYNGTG